MPNLSDNLNYRMMCDPIKSIATRLRGLREVLELSEQEVADSCRLSVDEYRDMESGDADISVNVLQTIARRYGISLDVLMFGEEPKMNSYFITRAGTGDEIGVHLGLLAEHQHIQADPVAAGYGLQHIDRNIGIAALHIPVLVDRQTATVRHFLLRKFEHLAQSAQTGCDRFNRITHHSII